MFQLFGRLHAGERRPIGAVSAAIAANDMLETMMVHRQPGEIFWLERLDVLPKDSESGGEGEYKNYVASEHRQDQSQEAMGRLRVCAATQFRKSTEVRKPSPHTTAEHWIIRALVVFYAAAGMVFVAETILRQ